MRLGNYLTSLTRPELELLMNELNLTDDEEEVFLQLSKGRSIVTTADRCQCSVATVSNRISKITKKVVRINAGQIKVSDIE